MRITAGWSLGHRPEETAEAQPRSEADELTAELTASYWRAYDQRLAETSFAAVARQLPGLVGRAIRLAWEASRRAARIGYITNFALADSSRRKWILADLMADRHTAAELRSFTLRHFMLARVARLAAYARDAQLKAAGRQALTRVMAQAAGGVATVGVYIALGILLAVGALPLAVAGTAVLAIRSAQASLNSLLYAVNQCYEEGLYFSDYLAFCADAASRIPVGGGQQVPAERRAGHRAGSARRPARAGRPVRRAVHPAGLPVQPVTARLSRRGMGSSMGMLAIIAAIIFAIAWIINATGTATNAWFSVTDLFLIGLACLALHQAGIGSAWVRRR